jgi:hypothetical protein
MFCAATCFNLAVPTPSRDLIAACLSRSCRPTLSAELVRLFRIDCQQQKALDFSSWRILLVRRQQLRALLTPQGFLRSNAPSCHLTVLSSIQHCTNRNSRQTTNRKCTPHFASATGSDDATKHKQHKHTAPSTSAFNGCPLKKTRKNSNFISGGVSTWLSPRRSRDSSLTRSGAGSSCT